MSSPIRLKTMQTCPECLIEFRPLVGQVCCSCQCAAFRRTRMHREKYLAAMAHARAVQRKRALDRLGAQLEQLRTKGEIWRKAYRRGYLTGYARAVDGKAPQFTQGQAT